MLLALFFVIIVAAKCSNQEVGEFFNRPTFKECVLLEDGNFMACDGEVVPTTPGQIIMEDFAAEDELERYYQDKEERLYVCLRSRRRCR